MKKKYNQSLILIPILLVIILEVFLLQKPNLGAQSAQSSELLANQIIEKCKPTPYRPTCYDQEVPKLMDRISMEKAFEITRIIQNNDRSFNYCHILGHKLSTKEVAKNPDKWMDIIPRCPSNGMCSNGCIHGALQERFRAESLSDNQITKVIPDLQVACEARKNWNPTPLDQAICYHGLGHLTMYITNANFGKSLKICDQIAKKADGRNFTGVCYEGIFMQLFQPLEPEDFALAKGKIPEKNNLGIFCGQFTTKEQQQACWEEGWPLFREEVKTGDGIVNFCSNSPNAQAIDHCFEMLFTGFGQGVNFDTDAITKLCNQVPLTRQGQCFANGALSMIQADKKFIDDATILCSKSNYPSENNKCFETLANMALYNFHPDSTEFIQFCNRLPDNLQPKCLGK